MDSVSDNIKHRYIDFLFLLCAIILPLGMTAQNGTITGNGQVTYNLDGSVGVTGNKVFTSYVATNTERVDDMVGLDIISLFNLDADLTGGIKSKVSSGGSVRLSIYSYDASKAGGKGSILYRVKSITSSAYTFVGEPEPIALGKTHIKSNDIKTLLSNANVYLVDKARMPATESTNLFHSTMAYLNRQIAPLLSSPLNKGLEGNNYKMPQPVVVEIEVTNSTILPYGIKFPGMVEEFDLANYFDPLRQLQVQLLVNGEVKATHKAGNINPPSINLIMGDSLSFIVSYQGHQAPQIKGVPSVWIARFAGDLMYYCSPNVKPGEYNPWIGYDSRVHNMQLRSYAGDPSFVRKTADWHHSGSVWTWGCLAQRRMTAAKKKYDVAYTWVKYKVLKNGSKQRNNQREGLNIQFLNYWQNGLQSNFSTYSGEAKYIMGFDDDELFYINSQYHNADIHPPLAGGGIAKLDSIPSRGMPEGAEQIYDVGTGYPAQGFPTNIVISAYRKNREWYERKNKNYFDTYQGYEIQDIGTDEKHPFGTANGNVTAPGRVTVRAGNQVVSFLLNVKAPFSEDKGFHGVIEGNTWPAYFQNDIPYTLSGLKGLSETELNKFSLVYEGSDALGNLSRQTKRLKDLTSVEKKKISSEGVWTTLFNNTMPSYACITAYYRRNNQSSNVIVAGKELKPIFLLFFGEKQLEGKGLGIKIWLNDFRFKKSSEYSVPRRFGDTIKYTSPYARTYTFPIGFTSTFEAWDGDPNIFYDPGVEWFLSSRTLAERIPDSYLDGTAPGIKVPYLRFYIDGIEQTEGRQGKDFSYTWRIPGEHTLKVVYLLDGGLTSYQHKIIVVNYDTYAQRQQIGRIEKRPLTEQETGFLGIKWPSPYTLLEVKDVYSTYEYTSGPRVYSPYVNRWANHNDYAGQYQWNLQNVPEVSLFLRTYSDVHWFWRNWALHYSSNWRDHLPYGLPPYVPNSLVTRILGTELNVFSSQISKMFTGVKYAPWQITIPLISYTNYQGNRMRTNPSCVYDMQYLWNNESGAFSGEPLLPPSSSYIQAPDISDWDKDRQNFFYELNSGKKIIVNNPSLNPVQVTVRNVFDIADKFIATGYFIME